MRATDGSFRLNTDFRLSRFGESPAVGSTVVYSRNEGPDCPDECIKIAGPIDVSIDLMVCMSHLGKCYPNYLLRNDDQDYVSLN